MNTKEYEYKTNEQYWMAKRELKSKGYSLAADAFWTQIFRKDEMEIILSRAID